MGGQNFLHGFTSVDRAFPGSDAPDTTPLTRRTRHTRRAAFQKASAMKPRVRSPARTNWSWPTACPSELGPVPIEGYDPRRVAN